MWDRVELKEDSKALLRLNYWPFVLVGFVHLLVSGAGAGSGRRYLDAWDNDIDIDMGGLYDYHNHYFNSIPGIGGIGSLVWGLFGIAFAVVLGIAAAAFVLNIFVLNPIKVGCRRYMTMARAVKPQFGEMLSAFRNCYGNIVKTMFLMDLYIFLWALLLFIPGVVKSYEYRMVPYLMAEYPDMASSEAFRISREMMYGNKWEAFVLDLSFLGWEILSALTLGLLGVFFVEPYQMLTDAALYLTLKKTNPAFGYIKPDDNYYYDGGQQF